MRVSIVNFVSTAVDMMRFSDKSLFRNAGHDEFDYVVVKWLASPEVEDYLAGIQGYANTAFPGTQVHVIEHQTDPTIGYVPNLRAMMNDGINYGFSLNEYCGMTNTDVYHGPRWLAGLVDYAAPERVVNSLHITAVPRELMDWPLLGIVNENLGVPEPTTFNLERFTELYDQYYRNVAVTAISQDKPEYRHCATMPWLFHRNWWEKCGPWETTLNADPTRAPDRRFFDRVKDAGAEFVLSFASIIYHHEAVERKRVRPKGAEHLPEE